MPKDPESFVVANTVVAAAPLVPEIRLHLATEVTPLWEATEARLAETGLPPPFWAFAWPGSQALARLLLDEPALARGKAVLDFAAGCGLAGIAAAMAGASSVRAAELDPVAAAAIRLNAALNRVVVETLLGDRVGTAPDCALLLAGDICYERGPAERIVAWLRACAARGTIVLLADPGRTYRPASGLEHVAAYDVPTSRELEDHDVRATTVWRVLP